MKSSSKAISVKKCDIACISRSSTCPWCPARALVPSWLAPCAEPCLPSCVGSFASPSATEAEVEAEEEEEATASWAALVAACTCSTVVKIWQLGSCIKLSWGSRCGLSIRRSRKRSSGLRIMSSRIMLWAFSIGSPRALSSSWVVTNWGVPELSWPSGPLGCICIAALIR